MKFEINGIGRFLLQRQTKGIIEFIWSGILLFVLFFIGIKYGLEATSFQLIMYIWASFISITLSVFGPFYLRNKLIKVIQKIEFSECQIRIETKKGVFHIKNIEILKVNNRFSGFGKIHTSGYILKNRDEKKEFWLIDTFFNEMEEIESELQKHM